MPDRCRSSEGAPRDGPAIARPVLTNVQLLRFVAALSVLLLHCGALFLAKDAAFLSLPWNGGVDLFFVISGFIMAWLSHGRFGEPGYPARFLLRRAIRIVPPYWFFTTLMVAVTLSAPGAVRHTLVTLPELAASYAFLPWPRPLDGKLNPLLSQGWTLNYEAFFYLAFALALTRRRGVPWLALAFAAFVAAGRFVPERLFLLHYYANPMILEFVAGIGLAQLFVRGLRLPPWGSLLCGAFGLAGLLSQPFLPPLFLVRMPIFGLGAALLSASLLLAPESGREGPLRRFLRSGGDASYTLYLSHTFTANAVAMLWHRLASGAPWAGMAAAAAVSVAVAMLFYRFGERPLTEALNRGFGLRPSRAAERVAP